MKVERSTVTSFWRCLAKDLQKQIPLKKEPNIYEYNRVLAYLDDEYNIIFNQSKNCIIDKKIKFKYPDIENITNDKIYIKVLKVLFHEIGRLFILDIKEMKPEIEIPEYSIEIFVNAMLMPEASFIKEVIDNSRNNKISIKNIANKFNIDYLDVLVRGAELDLF